MTEGTIYIDAWNKEQTAQIHFGLWGSSDINEDIHVMQKAHEFKYAARRQGLTFVLDMVPPWKAWICRYVLRMQI